MTDTATAPATTYEESEIPPPRQPRAQKILRAIGWTTFFLFFLLLFTLIKLPEIRLKNYIQGTISSLLSPQGITLSAAESELSYFLGVSYVMKDVTIHLPPPDAPVKADRIEISPSLLPMILGKISGTARIEQDSGYLKVSFSTNLPSSPKREVSASVRFKDFNLTKVGLLQMAAGVRGGAVANGEGSFSGDLNQPSSWNGELKLNLSKILIDSQTLYGFNIPALRMSEGKADLATQGGKIVIKAFNLGKTGSTDDIIATVTGDALLGKTWDATTLNFKARFSFSQNILKSLSLLEMILGQGKMEDGSYSFALSGPIGAPTWAPAK